MKIGFIGFGNMAQAITKGLLDYKVIAPQDICACAAHYDKLEKNAAKFGIGPCKSAREVVENSHIVILAVKPYQIADVSYEIKDAFDGKFMVSLAAGFGFDKLENYFQNVHMISAIPNTPIAVGKGILICQEKNSLTEDEKAEFAALFDSIARIVEVESTHLDIAGTVAGCSPAFVAMFMEALGDAGVKYGLKRNVAYELAAAVIEGTGALYLDSKMHPGELKDAVCSPAGTTIKGVSALEKDGFRGDIIDAIDAIME